MSLTALAIENRAVTYFGLAILLLAGVASYFSLGQLEDPEFSIKTAVITTPYPGASPTQVELEVTDRIEMAIQELPSVKNIYSISRAGMSIVQVDIKDEYWSDRLPQVWDELRNKIGDAVTTLPPGVGKPDIGDDFGFVYGFLMALTGDGFSYSELEDAARDLRKELGLVEGVSRVELWGVQQRVVYVDVSEQQLSALGLSGDAIANTLQVQNAVVDAGAVEVGARRFRIEPTGEFSSAADIENMFIRPTALDAKQRNQDLAAASGELLRIGDVAEVRRGYADPPMTLMRYNGKPAIGIAVANVSGGNVVHTGRNIQNRIDELMSAIPIGLELHKISWQADEVTEAIRSFMVSLMQAIAIVLGVLALAMGWRMGIIIGSALILTILATFLVMSILGIDLQRMSLGALIIALGMMVDNAIVVADGVVTRLQQGMDRKQAAIEAASGPSMPLLGATVVAVMAFYPIFASEAGAGEYCRTLFTVVGIALLASWFLGMTITPLQCMDMLPDPEAGEGGKDPFDTRMFNAYRGFLEWAMRNRVVFMGAMVALLIVSLMGFGMVKQLFFPDSSRPQLMIDYWMPEGTRIQQVSEDLAIIEERLLQEQVVTAVSTFVGQGPPRFYLPVDSQFPTQTYGQLIINVSDFRKIPDLVERMEAWAADQTFDALVRVRMYGVGPSDTWPFEARFSGPAQADLEFLRSLGDQGVEILKDAPGIAREARTDMRQQVKKVVPDYSQERGRWASVDRQDLADATKRSFDGLQVGLYREGPDLYPILLRFEEDQRSVVNLDTLQIQPSLSTESVPLSQVVTDIRNEWEDPIIIRWDRRRAVTVQASPARGFTFPQMAGVLTEEFEAIADSLPVGYELFWDGEASSTSEAQASLVPGVIPAVIVILFIIVMLFNAYRPPIIIILTIPFAIIGVTWGLVLTGAAFGFVALLGAMSLSGMMIKNSVVLLDQVNIELAAGRSPYDAIVYSALSRLRPVVLAAATTVLGVIPLMQDPFWIGLAVTIMAGLSFGTVLTMIVVPTLYAMFYRIRSPEEQAA
ncbi:MAG: efflux RND transporter permease subunit [Gammaproteobacteria bacterium]